MIVKQEIFANAEQRKFYQIARAFKIGNIVATIIIIFSYWKIFSRNIDRDMSTFSQKKYIEHLKLIKETEEKT